MAASIARAADRTGLMTSYIPDRELSYPLDTLLSMSQVAPATGAVPWTADHVLALAPDASAQRAARGLAGDRQWLETGVSTADDLPPTVWGLCQGSGSTPYQTAVDLTSPAFKCTCPSRKLPCKHALGLLLRWSAGSLTDATAPAWVHEWQIAREERATKAAARAEPEHGGEPAPAGPGKARSAPSEKTQARRAEDVAGGLEELDRWLADQMRAGLASVAKSGYAHWDTMAARLVDAKAASAAGILRRMAAITGSPERLLGELAQLRLLVTGYRRLDELPEDVAASLRMRVGLPLYADDVRNSPATRDEWQVLGVRDEIEDRITVRRTWLLGAATGRPALVLSFAVAGQPMPAEFLVGTQVDADLRFYPGGQPGRGLLTERYGPAEPIRSLHGAGIAENLRVHAEALVTDPWLEQWPMVLDAVVPVRDGQWFVADADGSGLPLDPAAGDPWRLMGLSGGRPVTVAGEWSAAGLRPLSAFAEGRLVRL
jgi:hypothetical protein